MGTCGAANDKVTPPGPVYCRGLLAALLLHYHRFPVLLVFAGSTGAHVTSPRPGADLPAQLPFSTACAFSLAPLTCLLNLRPQFFLHHHLDPSFNSCLSIEEEVAQLRALQSEKPDCRREGLTSELSLLGPVSSSLDLTSPQETHTLSDPLSLHHQHQHQHPRFLACPKHPRPTTAPLARSKPCPSSDDLRSAHLHRIIAIPSNPPSQHAFFHGPRCT
jgi:hypothetical protein